MNVLATSQNDINRDNDALQSTIAQLESTIAQLESTITQLESTIAQLESTNTQLESSLVHAEEELALRASEIRQSEKDARRYRGLWLSEARITELLYREVPEGTSVAVSQARDWTSSSPLRASFHFVLLINWSQNTSPSDRAREASLEAD
jgi:hypothetical protein